MFYGGEGSQLSTKYSWQNKENYSLVFFAKVIVMYGDVRLILVRWRCCNALWLLMFTVDTVDGAVMFVTKHKVVRLGEKNANWDTINSHWHPKIWLCASILLELFSFEHWQPLWAICDGSFLWSCSVLMLQNRSRFKQVARQSQRDRAAGWITFSQKWEIGTGRQY